MNIIAFFFVISGIVISVLVYIDIKKHRQPMHIMEIVWPLTMLWASWIGLLAYLSFGRQKSNMKDMNMDMPMNHNSMIMDGTGTKKLKWESITLSTLHCGAGCVLADIIGETLSGILGLSMLVGWTLDYILALIFGVYFQYMAIKEMGNSTIKMAINKAVKSDFLSLTAWQIGMYGFMYFAHGGIINRASFDFWFIMQLAMMTGFITSYPMNMLLIKIGFKHAM